MPWSGFSHKSTLFLVGQPSHPPKTLAEFIEYARANPLRAYYGSAGTGTGPHIPAKIFRRETRIPAIHIPYQVPALRSTISWAAYSNSCSIPNSDFPR